MRNTRLVKIITKLSKLDPIEFQKRWISLFLPHRVPYPQPTHFPESGRLYGKNPKGQIIIDDPIERQPND